MILAFIAFQLSFIFYALTYSRPFVARTAIVVNMILILLFAPKLMEIFGFTTNVASVLYAAVMLLQVYVFKLYGHDEAVYTIKVVLFALLFALGSIYLLSNFPILIGNETFSSALSTVSGFSLQVVFASFFAFIFGQTALVLCLDYIKKYRYPIAILICQALDSLIFFPIAFPYVPTDTMIQIMLTGFVFKIIATTLMAVPLYYLIPYYEKNYKKSRIF